MYKIINTQTQYTLFTSSDLTRATRVYYKIPRRQHGDIVLLDDDTGEVIKFKLARR